MSTLISRDDYDRKEEVKEYRYYEKCEPKHPLPKKILLECEGPSSSMAFTSEGQGFIASSVEIDTTCLSRPKTKLEFSSVVSFNGIEGTEFPFEVRLRFELVKVCDNKEEIICDTQIYERIINVRFDNTVLNAPLILTDTFSFIFCECNTSPGCCQYFVRVISELISTDSGSNNVTATVSNGRISILASEC